MQLKCATLAATLAAIASAQNIVPVNKGTKTLTDGPEEIRGFRDMGMVEYGRGKDCAKSKDADLGTKEAVFLVKAGGTLANVIIGADAFEGVHCEADCTLQNVWFRDVCEDAISLLGNGDVKIIGGGAQDAKDKVIQHNGRGLVSIKGFTVARVGKLYRSCGDCTDNGGPRRVTVDGVKAYDVTSDLVGINSNYGDDAVINNSCGTTKKVCQEFVGIPKTPGKKSEHRVPPIGACKGSQGILAKLPAC